MGAVTYTARRALQSGVTDGDTVNVTIGFSRYDRAYLRSGSVSVSLSGARESILHHIETRITVETTHHSAADRPVVNQWIQSVMNGEEFTIDVDGSAGSAVSPESVRLIAETVAETRLARGYYRLRFDVVTA